MWFPCHLHEFDMISNKISISIVEVEVRRSFLKNVPGCSLNNLQTLVDAFETQCPANQFAHNQDKCKALRIDFNKSSSNVNFPDKKPTLLLAFTLLQPTL